jgi:hypothetical protein
MARIHGRNGIVYMGIATSAAAASPVAFLSDWTINFTVDKQDVTAMGDTNKIYVSGLPDAAGDFSGFYDDATAQTYTAATDGLPRNFYLYPSTNKATQYFFGTVLPDIEVSGGVGDAVKIKSSWNAGSPIAKQG